MKNSYLTLFVLLFSIVSSAQHAAKIVDSESGEFIPYANISIAGENLISNDEGFFTIPNSGSDAKVIISSMGYVAIETTSNAIADRNYIVKLSPAEYKLDEVNVKKQDPLQIMAMVRKNLNQNYSLTAPYVKDMLFMRTSGSFSPKTMNLEITKSTGFSKKKLEDANNDIKKFVKQMIAYPTKEYRDVLSNYFIGKGATPKIDVVKATKLRDETRALDAEDMDKSMSALFLKHLDSTKYYRIKSGWFGSRDTVTMRKDFKKKKAKVVNNTTTTKSKITSFLEKNKFDENSDLTFVNDPQAYNYKYEGGTYLPDGDFVFIIKFSPRKARADYEGTLYISESDYAVVRADYALGKGKTDGGMNLKMILGVKMSQNINTGTLIYKKSEVDNSYYLNYASIEMGQYFYLNRPLKFIELAEDEKDVFALDIKVEGNSRSKTEFLNISRSESSNTTYAAQTESNFDYLALKKYDPKIWKEISSIEPLEEMKHFTVPE